ncbi:MAG: Flp family type IVb pilin [Candidatus Sericytochromatia bacterium]|nr:Flp family type IVb pilin [Candidatus Sericytochromatia bacterium]
MADETFLGRLVRGEDAQAMVEYGLIAAAITIGVALATRLVQAALSRQLLQHHKALSQAP